MRGNVFYLRTLFLTSNIFHYHFGALPGFEPGLSVPVGRDVNIISRQNCAVAEVLRQGMKRFPKNEVIFLGVFLLIMSRIFVLMES